MPLVTVAEAVARLRAGDAVAFPTETVYGLGANADSAEAVAQVFALKGRPSDHPLIVHVADAGALDDWALAVAPGARQLATRFWPGPLTLILPRAPGVLLAVTGGQDTVGLRCPAHPLAHALLAACGEAGIRGLAAPSANRFGRLSPTAAAHVREEFGPALAILDGGDCAVGIESTIVDCSGAAPRVLRPGMLTVTALEAALGLPLSGDMQDRPRVSGSLALHYAPRTPLELVAAENLAARVAALQACGGRIAVLSHTVLQRHGDSDGVVWLQMPRGVAAYARVIYARLRDADALGVCRLLVEAVPAEPPWAAVADRLRRAAYATLT
jgi:L-threonylcarbamoyladenylate synthase